MWCWLIEEDAAVFCVQEFCNFKDSQIRNWSCRVYISNYHRKIVYVTDVAHMSGTVKLRGWRGMYGGGEH